MAAIKMVDFGEIIRAIRNELKIQAGDTESLNRIKQTVNLLYHDEIVPFKRWWWLHKTVDVQTIPFYADGTAAVTPTQAAVTLSVAPPMANGSLVGYYFSTETYAEVFTISAHTAGSASITLSKPYTGTLSTDASFKIWTDKLSLPIDLRESQEVRHDFLRVPMTGLGFQEFKRSLSGAPKASGRPTYFNVLDFYNEDSLEDTRFRQIQIYPAVFDQTTTLHIDYVREVPWLDDDTDEPVIPVEDRIVLYYAALSQLWVSLMRNTEEAARNYQLYTAKLDRMAGKIEEGFDKPVIQPDSFYFRNKRGNRIRSASSRNFTTASSGGGANIPTYAKNITIEGGTFTANMTASPGVLIDGRDLSVDGADLDAHVAASTDVHGVGPGNAVVGSGTTQTLTAKTIATASNTISDVTTSSVAIFNGLGTLVGSTQIDTTELSYLNDVTPLSTVALSDNQSSAANVVTWTATWTSIQLDYSILRGAANIESGRIIIVNDGTNAAIAQDAASLGTLGVTFTVDVSAGSVRLRYTSTSTGTAPSFKYKLNKWVA